MGLLQNIANKKMTSSLTNMFRFDSFLEVEEAFNPKSPLRVRKKLLNE